MSRVGRLVRLWGPPQSVGLVTKGHHGWSKDVCMLRRLVYPSLAWGTMSSRGIPLHSSSELGNYVSGETVEHHEDGVQLQGTVTVNGTIQKVQYRSSDSGYTVLKVGVSPDSAETIPAGALDGSPASSYRYKKRRKKGISITVVGILPVLHVGQGVSVQGSWTETPCPT